jgi:hypothetical protein
MIRLSVSLIIEIELLLVSCRLSWGWRHAGEQQWTGISHALKEFAAESNLVVETKFVSYVHCKSHIRPRWLYFLF